MIRFAVFIFLVGFATLVQASAQSRIVGGEISTLGEWPSAVALQISPGGAQHLARLCGGNLIAPNWVLTAAHCLVDEDGVQDAFPADVLVYAGQQNLSQLTLDNEFTVRGVSIHPYFDSQTLDADIALLELSRLQNQPSMQFGINPSAGQSTTVIGWGLTSVDPDTYAPTGGISTKLREVRVPVVSNDDCNNAYFGGITGFMFCAGFAEGGQDSCSGDSGGPIMVQAGGVWSQAGIVSFGDGCAKPGSFGVYTRVARFTDWINNTMNGGDPTEPGITDIRAQSGEDSDAGSSESSGTESNPEGGSSGGEESDAGSSESSGTESNPEGGSGGGEDSDAGSSESSGAESNLEGGSSSGGEESDAGSSESSGTESNPESSSSGSGGGAMLLELFALLLLFGLDGMRRDKLAIRR